VLQGFKIVFVLQRVCSQVVSVGHTSVAQFKKPFNYYSMMLFI